MSEHRKYVGRWLCCYRQWALGDINVIFRNHTFLSRLQETPKKSNLDLGALMSKIYFEWHHLGWTGSLGTLCCRSGCRREVVFTVKFVLCYVFFFWVFLDHLSKPPDEDIISREETLRMAVEIGLKWQGFGMGMRDVFFAGDVSKHAEYCCVATRRRVRTRVRDYSMNKTDAIHRGRHIQNRPCCREQTSS